MYDYFITLMRRGKPHYLYLKDCMVLICETLSLLHTRMLCAKFGIDWPSAFRENKLISLILDIS